MKIKALIILLLVTFLSHSQTQTRDVLYLKNGSVIKGLITEMNPSTGIKIKTTDGSLFVYKMDEILKTEKEEFVGQKQNQQTSSEVSQKALDNFFINYFNEKRPALLFVGVSKVNGIKREVYGQKIYEVEYELIFDTKADIYVNTAVIGSAFSNRFVDDFSYSTQQAQGYEAALAGTKKKLVKGQRIVANGTINFEETDNGWRAKGYNNKNFKTASSNYVNPEMAKRIAEEKAQQEAELKARLDWSTQDTEPAVFEHNYYSLENVPFFEHGHSRYIIKPLNTFKGRNDVASKIQNTFYEALESTNRTTKSDNAAYTKSANRANYMFLITQVDFIFKETGYQCAIKVAGKVTGTYSQPNTYPIDYSISLDAKSNSFKKNMSKSQAFNEALQDFSSAVRAMVFKYEPIQLELVSIETNKRGKVDNIIFAKPAKFLSISKMDFIITSPGNVLFENGIFKITDKLGECTFKGKIQGDKIICDVSGSRNKKNIEELINNTQQFIGISSF
ncbi:MAG: hypothetical protein WDZ45_11245 [Flavobacteriaceae bacterium]